MRRTSIETYHQIKEEGLLSRLKFQVYEILFKHGPLTQGEAWSEHFPKQQRHTVAPRFAELEKLGVIESVGERPCRVTGRNSMVWATTDRKPIKLDKPHREKCRTCGGTGFIETQQTKLF